MALSRSSLLATMMAGALMLLAPTAFLVPLRAASVASAAAVAALAPVAPALAGEPPSVGAHWYWDLGIGSLHGETASIILLVFFLLVAFSLIGAGGSTRKA
eukprot:CAMPEP_0197619948 /NCGR_PEP_ID=MMETSP1338-20131121/887_1 /TAXON_ID=43686 ORGANISM="Pelagodinium beii, Strain RCC1491" /NCGR_SAMPLE_ID=MMETSP1338 /ASSEMBLY_ACC=CAM_ASM_000754 /LENGTH=100 /DNA_ID=CAMNT_0043189007 /DNA_START=50 /DNA_END=352 /DNA_ORIENTATION=+